MNVRRIATQLIIALALAGLTVVSTACASPRGRMYVRVAPPVPIVEVRAAAPDAGWVWVPGYYTWNGRGYVWLAGRWERPPRGRFVWVPAHWTRSRRGWYLVRGHWR
ncbi:MAG TPA: hypothetical protein VIC33_17180 [Vicinamibacterales bacterium]|jgi:hypothetical protein